MNIITKQEVPIPDAFSLPLENNFYEYHWNVKVSSNNVYKGDGKVDIWEFLD